jgi:opacity protein-like surface antigen
VREARADWLVTPFVGATFGTETAFLQPDPGAAASKHAIVGAGAGWLGDGVLGVEADVAFAPGFFTEDGALSLIVHSRVTTLFGNVIAAVPISVTRESLRPYLLGGIGLVSASLEDVIGLAESDKSVGLQVGGGAIGMLSNRVGVRFDLRQTRTLRRETTILAERQTKLSFWRATLGVVLRY